MAERRIDLSEFKQLFALRPAEANAAPGTVDERASDQLKVRAFSYSKNHCKIVDDPTLEQLRVLADDGVLWIDLIGSAANPRFSEIGTWLELHPLALEDAQSTHQRPKLESFAKHDFFVMRVVHRGDEREELALSTAQLSLFVTDGVVVTLLEDRRDAFLGVRRRLEVGHGRLRARGADYLAYALIDAAIDHAFPVLEHYGDQLELLEEALLARPVPQHLARLHALRRELLALRKAYWPLRDAIGALYRDERPRWSADTQVFMRDAYDHTVQLLDVIETFREMASSLLELYMSSVSNKMNDVMKLLTIITTVFVPLSFIAGLYGMNFNTEHPANMPELGWSFGYPYALGLMATVALVLVAYFWRKGWIGGSDRVS